MHYFFYISCAFLLFQLFNVLLNFIFRQRIPSTNIQNNDLISILIPARNEENVISGLLDSLSKIKNDNIEIIVCNDHSTDSTKEIVLQYAEKDKRITLIDSIPLPEGWLGKNHACYQLSLHAKGQYFLFLDADVELSGTILSDLVLYVKKHKLGLLSIFPKQIQKTIGEKLTVPIMNYILITLLPLIFVRISPFTSHAAANGQCMLFDAEIYKKLNPHHKHKQSVVEDITIARYFKKNNIKIACTTGENRVCCRMYTSYNEALQGFSKNIFMFFGNIPIVAFLFWIVIALGIIPIILFKSSLLYGYVLISIIIQILYAHICKQNLLLTVIYQPVHVIFMLQVMIYSLIVKHKRLHTWKGRNIY